MECVANGLTIAYRREGVGPPVVFLHGAAGDGRIWAPQFADLTDEFTVIAWDEPGAGGSSDLPHDFTLADIADVLAAMLDSLDLGPAHIAGNSWGGTVLLEFYRRHPDRVATLIMIDTYAGWKGSLPADEVRARVAGARMMLSVRDEAVDPTVSGLFASDPPKEVARLLATITADVRPDTLRRELAIMAEADLSDLLPRITVPTLLIWGRNDLRSPLTVAHRFHEVIPDSTLVVIDDAGHLSHLERPEQVNHAVRQFCHAHPPSGSV
ncbi:alpha/beta hydrolase [Dietzia sp. PP-33]|jgi:pimeloyl-ACP methyl ester carboxylesterase|uniref:alpha/beta fold hydrolase n=1 Tax=Dietzia sp. PP-33 TaxID=2957500 RepID=UPI0029A427DA|nr:alpha/beta hydrolase [Dietzia sp. PP-33]MDX2355827.1 alpha/beta hydrolase [Dietzia sp. PP-33]